MSVDRRRQAQDPQLTPFTPSKNLPRAIIVCGNNCGHDHESLNGPTGCCPEHGPFMYFCHECSLDGKATR